jgi:hypothetical protein
MGEMPLHPLSRREKVKIAVVTSALVVLALAFWGCIIFMILRFVL